MDFFEKEIHIRITRTLITLVEEYQDTRPNIADDIVAYLEKASEGSKIVYAFRPNNQMLLDLLLHEDKQNTEK